MSMQRLRSYLLKYQNQDKLNLFALIREIKKLRLHHKFEASDIEGLKVKGDIYYITHFNPVLLKELIQLVENIGGDRNTAARQNLSHNHKVDGSFLLARHIGKHPQVVTIDEAGNYHSLLNHANVAVVVENRQLFLHDEKFFHFLQSQTDIPLVEPIDLLFGMGNELPNSLHTKFLSTYDKIYLCFDLDLGGLKVADNLYRLLPEQSIEFVQPKDIKVRLENVDQPRAPDYLQQVGELSAVLPDFLKGYAQLIRQTNRTLEQESFLANG